MGFGLAIHPDQAMGYVSRLIDSFEVTSLLVFACGALASISVTLRAVISYRYLEAVSDLEQKVTASNPPEDRLSTIGKCYRWVHLNFLELPGFPIPLFFITSAVEVNSIALLVYAFGAMGDLNLKFMLLARKLVQLDQ